MEAIVRLGYLQQHDEDGIVYVWVATWLNRVSCLCAYGVDGGGSSGEVRAPSARRAVDDMIVAIRSLLPDIQVVLVDEEKQTEDDLFSLRQDGSTHGSPTGERESSLNGNVIRDTQAMDIVDLPPVRKRGERRSAKPST
jgi:hypothetical protein